VLAFSFGKRSESDHPGKSNEQLARVLLRLESPPAMVVQHEIATALPDGETPARVVLPATEDYVDTRQVAEQALVSFDPRRRGVLMIVAHPNHAPRAGAVCRKLGFEPVFPPCLEKVLFDRQSDQWWTRGRARWMLRETLVILHYRRKHYI
jgi:hypothetical protein